jgi:hypothetical protein
VLSSDFVQIVRITTQNVENIEPKIREAELQMGIRQVMEATRVWGGGGWASFTGSQHADWFESFPCFQLYLKKCCPNCLNSGLFWHHLALQIGPETIFPFPPFPFRFDVPPPITNRRIFTALLTHSFRLYIC